MQKNLTKGSVLKTIISFSIPFLISNFLQTLYGLVDIYFVGQNNGSDIITAVSVGSQIMHMLTVIIVGLAMGGTVMISQSVGAKDDKRLSKNIGNTISLFVIFSVVATIVLLLLSENIVAVMSTPKESVSQTNLYIRICFAGIPFITAYNVICAILRGMGDSKSSMYFVAVACFMNIILDYIFVDNFGMKAMGAALATVIAQAVSVIISLIYLYYKKLGIRIGRSDFVIHFYTMKNILQIGVPVAIQDGFIQISFILITVIANKRGVDVGAAVGIVEKIIGLMFLVPSSMLSAISAIAAQNNGAGTHRRSRQTLKIGVIICVIYGAICGILCQFISPELISIFTDKEVVINFGTQYLMSYGFDCMLAGVHFCFSGFFCAYNLSIVSFLHNVASIVLMRIPGAYFASKWYPDTLYPMGWAAPLGSLISALICVVAYIIFVKKNSDLQNK